jgi:hypothetical protein
VVRSAIFVAVLLLAEAALAGTPFQFSAPNVQAPPDPTVNGVRFSVLHGSNEAVRGADLGLLSMSETGDLSGFSAILGVGRISGEMRGCATSLVNLHTGRDSGLNAALLNRVRRVDHGANVGFINVTDEYTMVDVGGLNVSNSSTVQLGFVNVTEKLESFQLGFINVAENGFLPVFPFFNFPRR